jgi:hypothetical protein
MTRPNRPLLATIAIGSCFLIFSPPIPAEPEAAKSSEPAIEIAPEKLPTGVDEARGRAQILHETIHGALQVMHRDFFVDDENLSLPSQSLQDVFKELTLKWGIEIRWLGVNAKTMDSDHKPKDRFEENAVEALAAGKTEFEAVERNIYRYAGLIKLQNECLKCHVPHRKSLEDRAAGLVINIPFKAP